MKPRTERSKGRRPGSVPGSFRSVSVVSTASFVPKSLFLETFRSSISRTPRRARSKSVAVKAAGVTARPSRIRDLDEGRRPVGRKLADVVRQSREPVVLADGRPDPVKKNQPEERPDDLPEAPEAQDPHELPSVRLVPLLSGRPVGLGLSDAPDRVPDEALFFGPDGGEGQPVGRDSGDEPGRPDDPDLEELARGQVRGRETGRPGVDDLRPAGERPVAPDEQAVRVRQGLGQSHRRPDVPGRPVPAVADDLPIELGRIGIAGDAAGDAVVDAEGPPLVLGGIVPLGRQAAAALVELGPQGAALLVRHGQLRDRHVPWDARTLDPDRDDDVGIAETAFELERPELVDRERAVTPDRDLDADLRKIVILGRGRRRRPVPRTQTAHSKDLNMRPPFGRAPPYLAQWREKCKPIGGARGTGRSCRRRYGPSGRTRRRARGRRIAGRPRRPRRRRAPGPSGPRPRPGSACGSGSG